MSTLKIYTSFRTLNIIITPTIYKYRDDSDGFEDSSDESLNDEDDEEPDLDQMTELERESHALHLHEKMQSKQEHDRIKQKMKSKNKEPSNFAPARQRKARQSNIEQDIEMNRFTEARAKKIDVNTQKKTKKID